MDQACAYGNRPVIMTYDSEFLEVEELRVSVPLYYVIVDLRAEKDTVVILRELQSAFPTAKSQAEKDVQNLLGAFNQSIAERSVEALKAGNIELLGKLMTEANKEFYRVGGAICPSQLTAPMLHKCLEHPSLQPYILGGKGVGAGGDGTAQFLCRSAEDQEKVQDRGKGAERHTGQWRGPAHGATEAHHQARMQGAVCSGHSGRLQPSSLPSHEGREA